ncbi:hypothetical protein O3G_MSEX012569 [Manduca sexta]|uniref:Uncharacterized protein n=1 Tax=Manduca sexta TaxID=7130 RepID=A0A921ZNK7_MANSE|nr:hypothetical protein O3G_MSEX012569 [Manduca sexta]
MEFSFQRQFQNDKFRYYEQSSYDSPGPSRLNRNFARFYDDPADEQDYIPLNSARKRPANDSWPRGSGAKRFGSRGGGVVQSFGSRLGPRPAQSQTNATQAGPSRQPANARKRARPDSPPPVILPQKDAKNKPTNKDREKYTLRPDREPSTALNGLLELGVGFLLKQMKQKFANSQQYGRTVTRLYYTRRLKKALRTRIRKIIMNKYVDNYVEIVDQYRKRFPMRTDKELVDAASKGEIREPPTGAEPDPSTEAPRAGMPCPNFFKKRMQRYVGAKLRKMFNEIREMYNPPIEESCELGGVDTEKPVNVPTKEQGKKKKWKIDLAALIHDRTRSAIQYYIPILTTILNMDPEYISTKASLLATTLKMDPTVSGEVVTGDLEEPETMQICDDPEPTQFFAKVRGLPNLPDREVMRPFLDSFKPQAVKTHKKMKNLLIVTFWDKDSFYKFLSQDGAKVGKCTLDIKISGKVNPVQSQKNEENENVDTGTDNQPSESNEKDAVAIELSNQIVDLLSSIRREDEQATINERIRSDPKEEENEKCTKEENGKEPQTENIVESSKNINECGEQNEVNNPNDEQNEPTAENIDEATDNLQTANSDSAIEDNVNVGTNDVTKDSSANEETKE